MITISMMVVLTDPDAKQFAAEAAKVGTHLAGWKHQGLSEPRRDPRKPSLRAQRRLTANQLEQLIAYYRAGSTVYELAEKFRCNRTTVSKKLKDAGITLRRTPPTDMQINEMVRLYESGLSLERVGERVNFTAHTVLKYLRARHVAIRDTHGRPALTTAKASVVPSVASDA
ncbi:helix-turn-helix domain containing protein [Arthrobacter woluwensis]|uniref:helix-turn-helix domain containing protein n=1 Tax=Arthrobacter woluwensis TaxID=156980 RepID=UPI0016439AD3|nr:helix-turn-helix domain containing protein [Arthrobacter woluwensis]